MVICDRLMGGGEEIFFNFFEERKVAEIFTARLYKPSKGETGNPTKEKPSNFCKLKLKLCESKKTNAPEIRQKIFPLFDDSIRT